MKTYLTLGALVAPFMGVMLLSAATSANAESSHKIRATKCPVIVDRQSGKYTSSKAKYRCYTNSSDARRSGYSKHSFSDESACSASPTPNPGGANGASSLSGPGQKESIVFLATNGGSVAYAFPGGGKFEIKVLSASSGSRLQQVLETTQAAAGSAAFAAQSIPVYIKVEGPGAWTASVTVN